MLCIGLAPVVLLKLRMFTELGVVDTQLVDEPFIVIKREYERQLRRPLIRRRDHLVAQMIKQGAV